MPPNILVYLLRRDLRASDNPILHSLATQKDHGFTHLLPVYVFSAQQIEVSGFVDEETGKSPYPEARSRVAGFWRCGPHRAKFLARSVWDVKNSLEEVGSGLCVRVGMVGEVVKGVLEGIGKGDGKVGAVWMTGEESLEEKREESDVRDACEEADVDFKIWGDEKYLVDDRDLPFSDPKDLPDVFTTYRKMVEPLRDAPREALAAPEKGTLPPFPADVIPPQHPPFKIPETYKDVEKALLKPITRVPPIKGPPTYPSDSEAVFPCQGGESQAHKRLNYLITSGSVTTYKASRNQMLGADFSTKLSAHLALGCITSRQIHSYMLSYENGTSPSFKDAPGYGGGQNEGTGHLRFELLWRDYMRLCTRKFGSKLFTLYGFREDDSKPETNSGKWYRPNAPSEGTSKEQVQEIIDRFLNGTTGMGLIDASQRELFHTGYTSNRARQNVASFLSKHLHLDWRIGAEYYESTLVDHDVNSNWGNWQYVAGVGNDPRGEARIFNPVKQAFDYDAKGEYTVLQHPRQYSTTPVFRDTQTRANDLQSQIASYQQVSTPKPPKRERSLRPYIWAAFFLLCGLTAGNTVRSIVSPLPPPEPDTEKDKKMVSYITSEAEKIPLVQSLSTDPDWKTWEAYSSFAPEDRKHRLTTGPLGGSRGLGFQRVFYNQESGECISVVFLGKALAGWPGVTHGGLIASLLDESLGRCAVKQLPAGTAVTANLEITYLKPCVTGTFYVIRALPKREGSTERKGFVTGRLETTDGIVLAEAKGLFVVPKRYQPKEIVEGF
ncbi:hypothetical protein B7494_g2951 [Chlorociboria aeruginascens]|nr:hypothetical protein B7494_g2951 [Chlorociboria aeruginascens]